MQFAHSAFAQFMASTSGRILRVAAGVVLVACGLALLGTYWGPVLIGVGLVPLVAGLVDVCFLTLLLGGPFAGPRVRALRA